MSHADPARTHAATAPVAGQSSPAASIPRRSSAGRFGTLFISEVAVLFRRSRTIAMLVALAAVPVLIAVAIRLSSSDGGRGGGPAFLASITENGLFVSLTGLAVSIPLFLPLTVGVVAGDTIAGEAGLGTLRYLLVAPAGRLRLLLVKFAGAAVFCAAATLVIVLAGAAIGAALFPIGPVTLLSGDTIGMGDYAVRALLMAAYVTISMLGLSAIGLFISTLTTVPVGAMATTVVLAALAQILGAIPQLDWLHPLLFSYHWLGFADLLRQPIAWDSFVDNSVLQAAYIVVFGAAAALRFRTKDVLS